MQIKFVTRSGSNQFTGSLYEYHRNPALNANYWFNNRDLSPKPGYTNAPRDFIILNQFGGRLGGPIWIPKVFDGRDKAFFFVNYEEYRIPEQTTRQRTIMSEQARNGIFRYGTNGSVNLAAAATIGFPLVLRAGFSLGGRGSAVVRSADELAAAVPRALLGAPQVLLEESLLGWKELEYELLRDPAGNSVAVCTMENVDPMGVHTGESIVVAPAQTLSDADHQMLRDAGLRAIAHLGIVGECNIQFALDPRGSEFRVIEVNPRLSRSSALASKATGYPLAYVAAKLALGYTLPELRNAITGTTSACFEPALDYLVCKVPRWDLEKFDGADLRIGTEMKSVGEVMAIGRTFKESLGKAMCSLETGTHGFDLQADDATPASVRSIGGTRRPRISIGVAGKASSTCWPRSL